MALVRVENREERLLLLLTAGAFPLSLSQLPIKSIIKTLTLVVWKRLLACFCCGEKGSKEGSFSGSPEQRNQQPFASKRKLCENVFGE